jgi:glycosyltransferase involved in cell wall biosynthesis
LKNSRLHHADHHLATAVQNQGEVSLLKFVCDFGSGGTEGQIFNLVRELDAKHFKLEFAALNMKGPFVEKYAQQGIAIREFPIPSLFSLAACAQMLRLAKYLRSSRIEILHAYNFYSLVFAIPAAKLAGVPVVIASIRDRGVYLTKTQKWLQKLVCGMADRILVNAESIRDWLLEQGYQQQKITVIKNGIDLSLYDALSVNSECSIRADWGIKEDAPLVVMLARLNPQKGVVDFIQSAALVKHEHPEARFLIVGKPSLNSLAADVSGISHYQQWLNLRAQLKLEDSLFFCGHRSDVAQILSQAAVSVLPSHSEGLSNTLLESMAAGAPIVATNVGGTPELIENGVNGILVPPHSPGQLAEGISRVLGSKELALQFSQLARREVRENFSLDAMVRKTNEIYLSQSGSREVLS